MNIKEKEIWKYENSDRSQIIILYEVEKGLLINYPEGIINLEGVKNLFKFLTKYNKKNNKSN